MLRVGPATAAGAEAQRWVLVRPRDSVTQIEAYSADLPDITRQDMRRQARHGVLCLVGAGSR